MTDSEESGVEQVATPQQREQITVTPAQVAAAKLQLSIDRKFGGKSPGIIRLIAAAK